MPEFWCPALARPLRDPFIAMTLFYLLPFRDSIYFINMPLNFFQIFTGIATAIGALSATIEIWDRFSPILKKINSGILESLFKKT